jgi:hypothetical protein
MIRIAKIRDAAIEVAKMSGIAIRLIAIPIEAQITTSPNAKSLRVHTMRTEIKRATTITIAVHNACVGSGMPGISTFKADAMLAMMASEIQPR